MDKVEESYLVRCYLTWRTQWIKKQCFVCGKIARPMEFEFWNFRELLSIYQVSQYRDLCNSCATNSDGYINYFGKKKDKDKKKLREHLVNGVLVIRSYQAMMNAGYYSK